ncbi:replicative DNA helicase [Rhizobium sp. BK316]|uniref:replicative DNA helicase n=1 Tax=Rhizobium sp. BK316 TaxID=2587053 RepID=UPI00161CDC79|nr:DnaB-like helicase C-terminal domain-containing protein [Rhizobium sp. BK316]MBB3411238.1 replicative DNA helicase [Rhizobium sp. BK316]
MTAPARNLQTSRSVPESLLAEQQLIGAIMMNGDAFDAIRHPLEPEHFYEPLHGKIYEAMKQLRADGKRITTVSIMPFIRSAMKVGDLTVAEYLALLVNSACMVIMVNQHAEDIIRAAAARWAIEDAEDMIAAAYDRWGTAGFLDEIDSLSQKIRTRCMELSAKEHARPGDSYMDRFNASAANQGSVGVAVGLSELRKVLNEDVFEAGNFYGLLSASNEGKTSLTIQIMLHALKCGHPVLFLSYDQSQGQCVAQMIAQVYGIDSKQQKNPHGLMSQSEQDQSINFATWINTQPIDIIRCHRESNPRLIGYAKNFIAKHKGGKTPFIVIDHIKKIKPRDERQSPDRIAGEINVEWKSFADETKTAVLMLNQRNGEGDRRLNPRPISKDLYGGAGAREDYDAIVYLYRPEKYRKDMLATAGPKDHANITAVFAEFGADIETVAEIGVIKSRFGDTSVTQRLKFEARYTRYVSMRSEDPQGRMI